MDKKDYYIALLKSTAEKEGRLPKKSDFPPEETAKIKGIFGPWPWALAEAGLIESKRDARIEKNREKRRRAKERRKSETDF